MLPHCLWGCSSHLPWSLRHWARRAPRSCRTCGRKAVAQYRRGQAGCLYDSQTHPDCTTYMAHQHCRGKDKYTVRSNEAYTSQSSCIFNYIPLQGSMWMSIIVWPGVFQSESVCMFWNAIHVVESVEAEVHTNRTWTCERQVNCLIIRSSSDCPQKAEEWETTYHWLSHQQTVRRSLAIGLADPPDIIRKQCHWLSKIKFVNYKWIHGLKTQRDPDLI